MFRFEKAHVSRFDAPMRWKSHQFRCPFLLLQDQDRPYRVLQVCLFGENTVHSFQLTFYVHSWAFTFAINLKFDCVKLLFSSGFLSAPSYRKEIIDKFKRRRFLCHNFYTIKYKPIFMTHLTAAIIYDMPNLFWLCIFDVDFFKWYFFLLVDMILRLGLIKPHFFMPWGVKVGTFSD